MVYKKDLELQKNWVALLYKIKEQIGVRPKDLNSVLFLVGVQELGKGMKDFSKEEKQDLIHIAICKIFEPEGYYKLEGTDEDGWPHYELQKALPHKNLVEQVSFMRKRILGYFKNIGVVS